jgi:hypothetical protein
MWRGSATFRRQWTRLASARVRVTVAFDKPTSGPPAQARISRAGGLRVEISLQVIDRRAVEYLAHEIEHVLLCRGRCRDADLDENLLPDVYVFDRATERFNRASGGSVTWWAPSLGPVIDGRGQVVVFSSREPFGPEDLTSDFDLFVCSPVCG